MISLIVAILAILAMGAWLFDLTNNTAKLETKNSFKETPEGAETEQTETFKPRTRASRPSSEAVAELEDQLNRLKASGRILITQRDEARKRAQDLLQDVEGLRKQVRELVLKMKANNGPPESELSRFRSVKAAFARLYHPDRNVSSGFERSIREQVFKEFWAEIERIEKSD